MTALAGGHIISVIGNITETAPFARSGKVRPIVVTVAARSDVLPDVPTMRESGFPELEATNWGGFVVPAATPTAAVARLNADLVRALRTAEIQEKFKVQDMMPAPGTPEQFASLLQSESARYSKVVREANIRAE